MYSPPLPTPTIQFPQPKFSLLLTKQFEDFFYQWISYSNLKNNSSQGQISSIIYYDEGFGWFLGGVWNM